MQFQFVTEYPFWLVLLCMAFGALMSYILYGKNHHLNFEKPYQWLIWLLRVFRFLSLSILSFLLLNPLLKYISKQVQKPVIVLAIDNSKSILTSKDSNFYKKDFLSSIEQFKNNISKKFEIDQYVFGNKVIINQKPNFNDNISHISDIITQTEQVYAGRNIGALILCTDGIFNKGSNPNFVIQNFKSPIYTIGLGDTIAKKDIKLGNIRHNSIAYLGNTFPINIDISAQKCNGQIVKVSILQNGNIVSQTSVTINSNDFYKTIEQQIQAQKPGLNSYQVTVSFLDNEITWANNSKEFFIDIIDSRQKIMICYASPHPDISAYKQAIERNANYEVKVCAIDQLNTQKLNDFDLVLLHQLPNNALKLNELKQIIQLKIPVLMIFGKQTNIPVSNAILKGVSITSTSNASNQSTGYFNENFNLFECSPDLKLLIRSLPPLICPYGNYNVSHANSVFLFQEIGSVKTQQPLVLLNDELGYKMGYIFGEGFWRWRLIDFDKHKNHNLTSEFINKIVQYLAVKNDKRKFKCYPIKRLFDENESVMFNAEIFNESFELINKDDIKMVITNENKKTFQYTFSKTSNAYYLDAGVLPPGKYSYKASVLGKNQIVEGIFNIRAIKIELSETKANHDMLKLLSNNTKGAFYYPNELQQLEDIILKSDKIKPMFFSTKTYNDLINNKWLFAFVFVLLGIEWFIRKYFGYY